MLRADEMGDLLDVTIIIVCWNSGRYIYECLSSIYRFSRSSVFEVIVIDNGSTDATVKIIQRNFPTVRLIEAGKNLGFALASNRGIQLAKGRFLFLLNPDTKLETDATGELAVLLRGTPRGGGSWPENS